MGEAENGLLEAVRKNALAAPGAPAFRSADGAVTSYAELWGLAGALASALMRHTRGRGPVLVLGEKDARTVAAFLACLMSGHAFVPVDASLPAARVRDIAGQIERPVLLSTCALPDELRSALAGCELLDADGLLREPMGEAPDRRVWVAGDETQYVIFTSGSTGRPKGIEVSADNVAAFMRWLVGFPVIRDGGRAFLDQAHYSFDLSEYELVGALATGGCLCAVGGADEMDFSRLFAGLAASGLEVWVSTPSFADLCLADPSFRAGLLPRLRLFLFCGETLHHTTAAALAERFPDAVIANTYGPTESTVAVTYGEIGAAELADPEPLPVGSPRPGTELRIVDHETGARLPAGETGEIVICGDTVAKGYYANPEKTAACFFETTLADGTPARGYRTGDLGHLDGRGVLHCEGRLDSLVKVNGFRIELAEVEGTLEGMEGIEQAAVVPREARGRVTSLSAFVVVDRGELARGLGLAGGVPGDFELSRALKAALGRTLPSYMVPRRIRVIDEMPLTANEKIDRRALASRG